MKNKTTKSLKSTDRLLLNIGTLGGIGRLGCAPGTNASLLGAILYPFTFGRLGWLLFSIIYALCVWGSIYVSSRCEKFLKRKDPSMVNLDELVAMPLCYWPAEALFQTLHIPMPPLWITLLLGFLLFRVFDILKPFGIKKLESLKGGVGIVGDDLAAAIYTTICLMAIFALFRLI